MTDTRAWTTFEQAVAPSDTPAFGAAEVAYALSLGSGEARQRAEKALQVAPGFITEQIAALGASSLLARGELTLENDELRSRGAIRLLIAILQSAVRWTEIGLVNEDGIEAALYLQSPELSVFLQPGALSTWSMVVKAPDVADVQLLEQIIAGNAARHPLGTVYFGTELISSPLDGSGKTHLFVRPSGEGGWDVADAEAPGDGRSDGVDSGVVRERLAAFVALPSA